MMFWFFKTPKLQTRIQRELEIAQHQLMDAEATAEAAEATVILLQGRIERLQQMQGLTPATPETQEQLQWPSL